MTPDCCPLIARMTPVMNTRINLIQSLSAQLISFLVVIIEWTEEDESGCVQHIIEQSSTITTDEKDAKCKFTNNFYTNRWHFKPFRSNL